MEITLLIHAQSEYNKLGLLQGRIGCNLSEEGINKLWKEQKHLIVVGMIFVFLHLLKELLKQHKY